jgi:hypothetical protein
MQHHITPATCVLMCILLAVVCGQHGEKREHRILLTGFGCCLESTCFIQISLYESRTKPRPGNVVTSPAVPGRRIGWMDGLDRAFLCHFASSNFTKINPQSTVSHIKSFIIPLKLFQNQPAVQAGLTPQSGLLSTRNGPLWAEFSPKLFSYFSYNFLFS